MGRCRADSGTCWGGGGVSGIPSSWIETELGQVADSIQYGHTAKSSSENIGPHFLRITDIQDGGVDWSTVPYCSIDHRDIAKYGLITDDLVFARTGATVGKSFLIRGEIPKSVFASYLIRVRLTAALAPQFTYYFFQSGDYWRQISDSSSGIGQPNVNGTKLAALRLPLPPLAEQKRIVSKIEELFSELDAGEESLRRARRQLGVYRQSLLKQAFEGKLTAPWRKRHADLVENWSWLTLHDIAAVTGGLTKNSKREIFPTRIPYLRVANVYANELRLDEIKDIGVTPEEAKKVRLAKGDLLIVEGNGSLDQIGRVAMWDGSIPDCGHQNHLIRARCNEIADPGFVLMFLLSPHGRELIEKQAASTSGLHTLSVSKVQRLPVPLCSLPEQREIVRLLDEQFTVIEQNERELDAALKRSAALRQSILKKAFTGQLVPQDPTDEPASALLERIRKERETASGNRKTVEKGRRPIRERRGR